MKSMSFLRGIGIAFALALASSVLFSVLNTFVSPAEAIRVLIPAVGLTYLLCLLTGGEHRAGRITAVAAWGVAAAGLWLWLPGIALYLSIHAMLLWAIRALYRYSGVLGAALDLGLTLASLAAAVWAAQHTGSVFLSVWCLFLTQALFVFIPARIRLRERAQSSKRAEPDSFTRAQQTAEAALRRLSANS